MAAAGRTMDDVTASGDDVAASGAFPGVIPAISRMSFLRMAEPKSLNRLVTTMKAPGPPMTQSI